jgi:hypothetical protein
MTEQETTLLIYEILNKALEGDAIPFTLITCWNENLYYLKWSRSTKIVIKTLKTSANKLFKEYCQDVIAGISDVTKLLAYKQLLDVIAFYENDLRTVQKMLDEYDDYLGDWGNFWRHVFLRESRDI